MARDFIKIDTTLTAATQAPALRDYIAAVRRAYEAGAKVRAIMVHNNDGTVFTDIETLYGLPAGKGQIVFNLINGSVGSMEGLFTVDDAKAIAEKVG